MLNTLLIRSQLKERGLSQTALADALGVSKEAVSNWLSGESLPRPRKLKQLADFLNIALNALLAPVENEPVVAYRTNARKATSDEAIEVGLEVGHHLEQLLPYLPAVSLESPRMLREPSADESYAKRAADATRERLGLGPHDVLTVEHLVREIEACGCVLVPVLWGGDKHGHENAMSVFLPSSKSSWVLLNLGCKQDDVKYWLSHELGHCLTLHSLRGEDGELFSEAFAKQMVFPDQLADSLVDAFIAAKARLSFAQNLATRYAISEVSVIRSLQRACERRGLVVEKIDTETYFEEWRSRHAKHPTAAEELFGTNNPQTGHYIQISESVFKTPLFKAIEKFQRDERSRNPAFVARALNVGVLDGNEISAELWKRSLTT